MIKKPFKITDVKEIYASVGDFEFKVVLDDDFRLELADSKFSIYDSSGKHIGVTYRTWGNKIKCQFSITQDVSDGVATAVIEICEKSGQKYDKNVYFWVIK